MALLYLLARCQPQTRAQPQDAPAPPPPIQRPSPPRPLGDRARLRPPLELRPGASLTTPRSALARPLPFRLSFPVRFGPVPAPPREAVASYLGLADAQVRGGTVQPLLLFNALLDCCGREGAVTGRETRGMWGGVRDVGRVDTPRQAPGL